MSDDASLFFDNRFLERHAGAIIQDSAIAIVELVANSWDAWATRVDIVWPETGSDRYFEIEDNGKGMSEGQFRLRWRTLDYDRSRAQGNAITQGSGEAGIAIGAAAMTVQGAAAISGRKAAAK